MSVSRRSMIRALAGVLGYVSGRPVSAAAQSASAQQAPRGLYLALDGMNPAITLVYRGEVVHLSPEEIMSALRQKEPL